MNLGYFTMPLHPPGSDIGKTMAHDLDQLIALDQLGYSEAWIGEHFTSIWENIPCPDLLIAQALARTEQIVLGTGVSCLPNHNPLMLAQRIAQLDQMAQGRFRWGIGSGGYPGDFTLFDIDLQHLEQRQLTRDILDAVLTLWNDPEPQLVEHPRWRYRVPDHQPDIGLELHLRPYQRPHPPIAVAGIGPRSDMLTLAGERGWIPMSINVVVPSTLRAHWDTYAESSAKAGRTADRSIWRVSRDVYIGETSAQARRDVLEGVLARDWRDYFLPLLKKSGLLIGPKLDPSMPDDAVTLEYLCENLWIVGDVEEVTQKLRDLYASVGGFGTLLVIGHEWLPDEKWRRSMELLMTEVAP
ncbi:MAG TPA: LLM class flavin-dependent oxidoreductase, partial [Ktedonobacterales bacterium]|nr:LLM class flavin-dependent oxidoreductase [Ktedonobacterales bacterium]